ALDDVLGAVYSTTSFSVIDVTNTNSISVKAQATNNALTGATWARMAATAAGISDYLRDFTTPTDTITNSRTLKATPHAAATATSAVQRLDASAFVVGINQKLEGDSFDDQGNAKVSLLNSGAITATATAIAKGAVSDHSGYMRAYGVDQSVSNVVTA